MSKNLFCRHFILKDGNRSSFQNTVFAKRKQGIDEVQSYCRVYCNIPPPDNFRFGSNTHLVIRRIMRGYSRRLRTQHSSCDKCLSLEKPNQYASNLRTLHLCNGLSQPRAVLIPGSRFPCITNKAQMLIDILISLNIRYNTHVIVTVYFSPIAR